MGAGTIKTSKEVLYQLNIQKAHGPTIPRLGSDPEKNQNSQWPVHPCFQGSSIDNGQELELLLARILAFSAQWSQIENTETEFEGDTKVAFILKPAERGTQ